MTGPGDPAFEFYSWRFDWNHWGGRQENDVYGQVAPISKDFCLGEFLLYKIYQARCTPTYCPSTKFRRMCKWGYSAAVFILKDGSSIWTTSNPLAKSKDPGFFSSTSLCESQDFRRTVDCIVIWRFSFVSRRDTCRCWIMRGKIWMDISNSCGSPSSFTAFQHSQDVCGRFQAYFSDYSDGTNADGIGLFLSASRRWSTGVYVFFVSLKNDCRYLEVFKVSIVLAYLSNVVTREVILKVCPEIAI